MAKKLPEHLKLDYDALNKTELLTLAVKADIPGASPAVPREELIGALQNLEPIPYGNPMDDCRAAMSTWLTRYWDIVQMQVPRDECPDCFLRCSDVQIAMCTITNKDLMT
jgi:hypothetical protein